MPNWEKLVSCPRQWDKKIINKEPYKKEQNIFNFLNELIKRYKLGDLSWMVDGDLTEKDFTKKDEEKTEISYERKVGIFTFK